MSLEMMTWAKRQFGLKSAKMVLIMLADEADSSGVCFLGQAKLAWLCEMSDRTVREHLKTLEAKDLLHRERRPADFVRGGRKVDAIVLHDHVELARPEFPGAEQERRTAAANRRYRVSYAEEERSGSRDVSPSQDQPEVSSGSPVDNYVSPSQPEPEVSSGKAYLTGRITSFEPEESRKNAPGALKGSRVRINPSNPIPSWPEPVDEPEADRIGRDRTGSDHPQTTSDPTADGGPTPAPAGTPRSVLGVPLRQLRAKLGGQTGVLGGVDDETVAEVVRIVFARSTRPVRSPMGLMIQAMRQPDSAAETIEEAEARVAACTETTPAPAPWNTPVSPVAAEAEWGEFVAQAQELVQAEEQAAAARLVTCRIHHVEHSAAAVCPGCRADALSGTTGTPEPGADGSFDLEAWRAQRRAARAAQAEQVEQTRAALTDRRKTQGQAGHPSAGARFSGGGR